MMGDVVVFCRINKIEFYSIELEEMIGEIALEKQSKVTYLEESVVLLSPDKIARYNVRGECLETVLYSSTYDSIDAVGNGFMLSTVWESEVSFWSIDPIQEITSAILDEMASPTVVVQHEDVFYFGAGFFVYSWMPETGQTQILNVDVLMVSGIIVHDQKLYISSHMIGDYSPSPLAVYDLVENKGYELEESDDGLCSLHQDTLFVWNDAGYKNDQWIKGSDWAGVLQENGQVKTIWTDEGGSSEIFWQDIFCLGDFYALQGKNREFYLLHKDNNEVVVKNLEGWNGISASEEHFWLWNDAEIVLHTSDSLLSMLLEQ